MGTYLEKFSIASLSHQWILWMGAVRIRVQTADKNTTIILLISSEVKKCISVRNKFIIKAFFTYTDSTHSLQRIYWWVSNVSKVYPNLFTWRNTFIYMLDGLRVQFFFFKLTFLLRSSWCKFFRILFWVKRFSVWLKQMFLLLTDCRGNIFFQMVCKWDRVIKSTPYTSLKVPSNSVYLHKSIVFVWFISLEAGLVCVLFIHKVSLGTINHGKKNIKCSVIYHER